MFDRYNILLFKSFVKRKKEFRNKLLIEENNNGHGFVWLAFSNRSAL